MARGALVPAVLVIALMLAAAAVPAARAADAGVAALQTALRAKQLYRGSIDGVAGPGTRAAVRSFQARRGLAVDGIAGPATRRALGRRGRPRLGSRPIVSGRSGWDVAALQFLLARAGFPGGHVDGGAGPRTVAAIQRFQLWAGLYADGVAGAATLRALRRTPPRSVLRFLSPMRVAASDPFGMRGTQMHTGLDFPAPAGTTVRAAGFGCVSQAGWDAGGYGLTVVIRHRFGMTSWYAHLNSATVRRGQCVSAGQAIGTVGSTGHSSGPHLHFELRLRGAAVDPRTGGI